MPFFRFMLHGRVRLSLPREGGAREEGEGGFYATRWAYGRSMEKAGEKVIRAVMADWSSGASSHLRSGPPPTSIVIEDGWEIGLLDIPKAPNRGSTLYLGDEDEDEGEEEDDSDEEESDPESPIPT